MAAESTESGAGASIGPDSCKNAAEYAEERLREEDGTVRPVQLAEEYDCTNSHMRRALMELKRDGRAERVAHGEYTAPDNDENTDADTDESVFSAFSTLDDDREDDRPSVGGEAHSEDRDTGEMSPADEFDVETPAVEDGEGNGDGGDDAEDTEQAGGDEEETEEIDADEGGDDDRDDGDGPGVVPVEDGPAPEPASGTGGIPIPVSTTTLFAGVALALLVMLWFSGDSGGGSEPTEEAPQDGPANPFVNPTELVE